MQKCTVCSTGIILCINGIMAGSILHWLKKTLNKLETVGLPDPASCSTIEEVQSTQAAGITSMESSTE